MCWDASQREVRWSLHWLDDLWEQLCLQGYIRQITKSRRVRGSPRMLVFIIRTFQPKLYFLPDPEVVTLRVLPQLHRYKASRDTNSCIPKPLIDKGSRSYVEPQGLTDVDNTIKEGEHCVRLLMGIPPMGFQFFGGKHSRI